jgi:hypothetical protein
MEKYPNGTTIPNLATQISEIMGMLPTPTSGSKHSQHSIAEWGGSGNSMRKIPGAFSQLNPRFVAEMMGFPPNRTELPFQNGEQNP